MECAASIAEREGWVAVTTRRLADEIEYSPPVLYGHFRQGRAGIVNAVAVRGFRRLADKLEASVKAVPGDPVRAVADAYLDFAEQNPATYQAMFSMPITAEFAQQSTPDELKDGFAVFEQAVGPGPDSGTRAEVLWAALHGLSTLTRDGRMPPELRKQRVECLVHMADR